MVKIQAQYTGSLHCTLSHGPSGSTIETDAPKDNMGKGESFSPTDLVGGALVSCILTTMGIVAKREQIPFEGASAEIEKEMTSTPPRKIHALRVRVKMPFGLSEAHRQKLEHAALHCPVHKSLHPDVEASIVFDH